MISEDLPAAAQSAHVVLRAGPFELRATARTTAGAMIATGVLVSSILLSTAVLVWASRRRP